MDQDSEIEWKGRKEHHRVDRWRKFVLFGSHAFSMYPSSMFLDALTPGGVAKFRIRRRPDAHGLSGNADAYYVNTSMRAGFAALCIAVGDRN